MFQKLKSELEAKDQKARLSLEMRQSMANQVHMYKEEVKQQRDIIKVNIEGLVQNYGNYI